MSSAKPYIGCKIWLISKAQNRYEGILYTIDKVNSTVVLAKGEWSRPVFYCLSTCQDESVFCPHFIRQENKSAVITLLITFFFTSEVFWNRGTSH